MTDDTASAPAPRHGAAIPHVLPPSVLLGAAVALFALTALTVVASRLDLGQANVVVALAIACLKASVVALVFMHLAWENRFQLVVLVISALFAVMLVGLVVFDTTQYQPDLRAKEAQVRGKGR